MPISLTIINPMIVELLKLKELIMRKFFKIKSAIVLTVLSSVVISCNLDDGDTISLPDEDLVEILSARSDLSILVDALERADLITTLKSSSMFTIIAPTNTSFTNFLGSSGFSSLEEVPLATLRQLLLNHIISARVEASLLINLQRNYLETLADGPAPNTNLAMYFDATDNDFVFNGVATATEIDVLASNGNIYIVNSVVDLPTISTFISADMNFEQLDTALDVVSPSTDLPALLSENSGPFTLFAPTNQAFVDLLDTNNDWSFTSDIEETLLIGILKHHVFNGNVRSTDISNTQTATTLEGDDLSFYTVDGNIEIADGAGSERAIIEFTDIQAKNGVIHVLTQVLLPDISN
jgi:uncharacterized surface protein with fasciclin (FAS1) repeats